MIEALVILMAITIGGAVVAATAYYFCARTVVYARDKRLIFAPHSFRGSGKVVSPDLIWVR